MSEKKTALVTGASSGIGLELTNTLLAQGYQVIANSRTITRAGTLTASDRLALIDGDIADQETAKKVVETAVQRFGGVDLLANNAGIFIAKPFTDYTIEDVDRLVRTNLVGFFFVTQYAVEQMRKQHVGHIVNITTTLAEQPVAGVSASISLLIKGGLNSVTKALAIEYASEGIRVNAVAPGNIDTPLHKNDDHGFLSKMHPIARMGRASEVVDAIMYLDTATFVTGEIIHVDGGAHAGKW
ncbi:SDR family NAD(P)-dependent oxidoreductase [Ktedonobacter racemifer]|uniref:Short-chain dehydrogenase/reductase SDR n=1 Tax=Ktedonobacter racemifer DSM 44963 TaxID=485913 RepID=D6TSL0_KTERA|nr:SDR family oxidoreductase [Ktedonobacter racemifer]EFH83411.1 short-chain dehydrogenase/reductase SDR [Ktedonobacter racemifer DSM 44963]